MVRILKRESSNWESHDGSWQLMDPPKLGHLWVWSFWYIIHLMLRRSKLNVSNHNFFQQPNKKKARLPDFKFSKRKSQRYNKTNTNHFRGVFVGRLSPPKTPVYPPMTKKCQGSIRPCGLTYDAASRLPLRWMFFLVGLKWMGLEEIRILGIFSGISLEIVLWSDYFVTSWHMSIGQN